MINVEQAITLKYPNAFSKIPTPLARTAVAFLRRLFHEGDINRFLELYGENTGLDFIDRVFDYLNFDYSVTGKGKLNIPASGKVMIIANHPLGALDALALIKLVGEVRRDVKIVANDMLMQITQIEKLLLPVDNMKGRLTKQSVAGIIGALKNEEAVIMFPSGEVSRMRPSGVRDTNWKSGFFNFAAKSGAPILPVYIQGRNSSLFYGVSMVNKPAAALLLPHEMFRQRNRSVHMVVGNPIPQKNLEMAGVTTKTKIDLLRKHLFRIGKGKRGIFATEKNIAHPEDRKALKQELANAMLLGSTRDHKRIYLATSDKDSVLMREVARLRELTFRQVGEGTGKRRDSDKYDEYYRHLVLWDDEELEVVGSYRIGEGSSIMKEMGSGGFYTASLFDFTPDFEKLLPDAIELGRSFIQPKFWGSRALDYLWQGIGAYLKHHPHVRYMFGPVSISEHYPKPARDLLVCFYKTWFGGERLACSGNPYEMSRSDVEECQRHIGGQDFTADYRDLKKQLSFYDVTVPTLYKHYADLCEEGGVKFLDFGVDPDFGNCIDGFILVDVTKVKPAKRKRYMGE